MITRIWTCHFQTQQTQPVPQKVPPHSLPKSNTNGKEDEILAKIAEQGNIVRDLKTQKADKDKIKAAVDVLLGLKKEYKVLTGKDAPPGGKPQAAPKPSGNEYEILAKIAEQGNIVRDLKTQKADKDKITAAVDVLLGLKKEYKVLIGKDAPPGGKPLSSQPNPSPEPNPKADKILEDIHIQGKIVRDMKSRSAEKSEIAAAVKILLQHKADYKQLTGKYDGECTVYSVYYKIYVVHYTIPAQWIVQCTVVHTN